jgi:chromosome segregation ATPase
VLEITTWIFILIVQVAIAASIAVIVLMAKLRQYQNVQEAKVAETDVEIARTKIRLQSSNQLKDMYFMLKAKYTALIKAQADFEDNITKLVHRDEQAKLSELFGLLNAEKESVAQELAAIEKSLLTIAITKDEDEKATTRKAALVQETSEYIDHGVGKIQGLLHQQNAILLRLQPFINKLPNEMEAKQDLLADIAELQKTVAQMGEAMEAVCAQNQILQNQVESILGESELAVRDLRKQLNITSKELEATKKAYNELSLKYQQTEEEYQQLHTHTRSKHAS